MKYRNETSAIELQFMKLENVQMKYDTKEVQMNYNKFFELENV